MNENNKEIREINIFKNSVALSIMIGKIGIRRKVSNEKIDIKDEQGEIENMDKNQVHVQKEILKCAEFDKINSFDNEIRIRLSKLALPAPFRRGIYLIPIALLEKVDSLIQTYIENREKAVAEFIAVYDIRKAENKEKLGSLYCEADYPNSDSVKNGFYIRVDYMNLGVPSELNNINPEVFQREKRKFDAQLESAAEEIRLALREGFAGLVRNMVEKLQDNNDGERRIFRDSLVKNMNEFLEVFEARNIANDRELQNLIGKAKQLLTGNIDAKVLRNDNTIRKGVREGFDTINKELDNLIEKAPRRKLELDY